MVSALSGTADANTAARTSSSINGPGISQRPRPDPVMLGRFMGLYRHELWADLAFRAFRPRHVRLTC